MRPAEHNVADLIERECDALKTFLIAKNDSYGNSALDPVRIFSRADAAEQLRVRIDDKLSRLSRGNEHGTDDTLLDLHGYLVLLRVFNRNERAPRPPAPPVVGPGGP